MSEQVRQQANELTTAVEQATLVRLPEPVGELVPLEQAEAPVADQIRARMSEIDRGEGEIRAAAFSLHPVISELVLAAEQPAGER